VRPLLVGGETVAWSTLSQHELRPPPYRFEAGLQNYAGVIGAHAGIDYLGSIGFDAVDSQQLAVNRRVTEGLADEERVHVLGPSDPRERSSIFAFTVDGVDANDVAVFLDEGYGVMVRSGMHCVHSYYAAHGIEGNARASFYFYNSVEEADTLVAGVRELIARVPFSGTSAGRSARSTRPASGRPRGAGSTGAAARSAPPRRKAARGRAGSAGGSG
jgi:cysteine desulfurase / selenocysteine lyase